MNDFFNINPKIGTALSIIIGYILIDDLTANEQNALGNWLILIGQTLVTNASIQALIETRVNNNNIININKENIKKEYNPLFYNIETLKNLLNICPQETSTTILKEIKTKINELEKTINENKNKKN